MAGPAYGLFPDDPAASPVKPRAAVASPASTMQTDLGATNSTIAPASQPTNLLTPPAMAPAAQRPANPNAVLFQVEPGNGQAAYTLTNGNMQQGLDNQASRGVMSNGQKTGGLFNNSGDIASTVKAITDQGSGTDISQDKGTAPMAIIRGELDPQTAANLHAKVDFSQPAIAANAAQRNAAVAGLAQSTAAAEGATVSPVGNGDMLLSGQPAGYSPEGKTIMVEANRAGTMATANKEAFQARYGFIPADYDSNPAKYQDMMISQAASFDANAKGLEGHKVAAQQGLEGHKVTAKLAADARVEAAKELAMSRIEAAKLNAEAKKAAADHIKALKDPASIATYNGWYKIMKDRGVDDQEAHDLAVKYSTEGKTNTTHEIASLAASIMKQDVTGKVTLEEAMDQARKALNTDQPAKKQAKPRPPLDAFDTNKQPSDTPLADDFLYPKK